MCTRVHYGDVYGHVAIGDGVCTMVMPCQLQLKTRQSYTW